MSKLEKKAFMSHKENGFRLNFPNGNSLSTVWGLGTYTDNNDIDFERDDIVKAYSEKRSSNTVEVMAGCSDTVNELLKAKFPDEDNNGVFGHLTFSKWLEIVNILNNNK